MQKNRKHFTEKFDYNAILLNEFTINIYPIFIYSFMNRSNANQKFIIWGIFTMPMNDTNWQVYPVGLSKA